ncbi:hypothetical protein G6F70_000955 [Rhizopus microsporus]|nr:hypothetical protein G6F71_000625 [Rhizopus microsporus]KAG1203958.1 hypothetical protein G6F70_000955 [Rhizopus microsporus]KAG1214733.1 hypothetical protein G6F69_001691 [Rhizopus microsporus]KAG1229306.1 hypothetical protein G6F67_007240 [Rhizopus microsporus]KAG1261310.1 hypothetical protein G6F68_006788 [Rhizopus microsporus]
MPKRGPPKSYTESVENRLQRVENALKSIATPVVNRVFDDSLKSKDFCNQIASTEACTVSISAPYTTDHLSSQIDRFTINEIGQAVYVNDLRSRVDRVSNMYVQQPSGYYDTQIDVSSVCDSPLSSAAASFTSNMSPLEMPIKDQLALGKQNLSDIEPLIEIYFEYVHKHIPIVHKQVLLKQMHNPTSTGPSRLLLYAMCAVASKWSPDQTNQNHLIPPGYTYYQKALGLLDDFLDVPRVSTVQALILIVKYQDYFQRVGYFHRSYAFLGLAAQMCLDLGLSEVDGDGVDAEISKRTFWAVFMYDLFMSIEQGRTTYFDASKCTTGYPALMSDENSTFEDAILNQNVFIQLSKILSVTYSVVRRLTVRRQAQNDQVTKEQLVEEQSWLFSIHTHLENFYYEISQDAHTFLGENQTIQDPSTGLLHLTYHFCIILLHQCYIDKQLDRSEYDFLPYPHRKLCANAASDITSIAEALWQRFSIGTFTALPRGIQHMIHCLSAAATIHRYEIMHEENRSSKDAANRQYVATIHLMKILSKQSPSLETVKCFENPVGSVQSVKKRASFASLHNRSVSPVDHAKSRPLSMTFVESQSHLPYMTYPMQPMQSNDSRFSYPLQSFPTPGPSYLHYSKLSPYQLEGQDNNDDHLISPTYADQFSYDPIPNMSELFLMDDENQMTQDMMIEM